MQDLRSKLATGRSDRDQIAKARDRLQRERDQFEARAGQLELSGQISTNTAQQAVARIAVLEGTAQQAGVEANQAWQLAHELEMQLSESSSKLGAAAAQQAKSEEAMRVLQRN